MLEYWAAFLSVRPDNKNTTYLNYEKYNTVCA